MTYHIANEHPEKDFEMAVRHRICFGGNQSFYQPEFLFENDAAGFAAAAFSDLSERSFWNRFGNFAFDTEIFKARGVGLDCAFDCRLSGEYLYGDEHAIISRIQSGGAVYSPADTIFVNCSGVLVHQK